MGEINVIKGVVREHGHIQMPKTDEKKMADLVADKTLTIACDRALNGYGLTDLSDIKSRTEVATTTQRVQKQVHQELEIQGVQKKDLGMENGNSIKL
jgi:hypothetical protein